MRTLVFWGDAPLPEAKARAGRGDVVLLWGRHEAAEAPDLRAASFGPEAAARIEQAAQSWAEALAERPLLRDGRFGGLFSWQEEPLWPLALDFFLSAESEGGRCVRLLESFSVVFEAELPDEVEAVGLRADEGALLARACTARGVLFQGEARRRATPSAERPAGPGLLDRMRRLGTTFARRGGPSLGRGVLLLVRPGLRGAGTPAPGETARGDLALALERLLIVARDEMSLPIVVLGGEDGIDPESLLDRAARQAVAETEAMFARTLEELKDAPSAAAAFQHEGVAFGDLSAEADLAVLLRQVLPRAVRRAEGVRAA
ncbi:MAG TPA: hypothetical protein VI589_03310, partial [Vicinamibacteria bacterium]